MKIVSEVIKRENDLKNIKELNKKYLDIKTKMNLNPIEDIKMNQYKEVIYILRRTLKLWKI